MSYFFSFIQFVANERNEIFFNRAESSVKILIKMSSNFECVPSILTNLQKFLPSIISICEQSTVGSKLYKPITKLLNRILQVRLAINNFN